MEKKRPKPADGCSPFLGLSIASHDPLAAIQQRVRCSNCGASRKYFCYTCYITVPPLQGKLPTVTLPLKVDVIKHARELDGKSTAIHAAVLAPNDVTIYTYPCIPDYDDHEKAVLVYPGKDAVSLSEAVSKERLKRGNNKEACATSSPPCAFRKVVFIDCTWNQTNQIYKDERLRDLQCVILKDRKTCFWRGQDKPDSYLATIEAIYYFMLDYHRMLNPEEEPAEVSGCYDNLLYFYSFMYELVHREAGVGQRREVETG